MNLRKLHRKVAPILFLPLLLTAITGVAYRIGRSWFGMSDGLANFSMALHEGRFVGQALVPVYVLLVGLGLVGMIATGITMMKRKAALAQPKKDHRWVHRIVGFVTLLPLLLSSLTGIGYRLGQDWFGISEGKANFLMSLHQGSFLGGTLRPFYVLSVGAGLVILLVTGLRMTNVWWRQRRLTTP